jgi:hypothetical protein
MDARVFNFPAHGMALFPKTYLLTFVILLFTSTVIKTVGDKVVCAVAV